MKIILSSLVGFLFLSLSVLGCKSGTDEAVVKQDAALGGVQPKAAAAKGEAVKMFIGPELAHCVGMDHRECNLMRSSPDEKWDFLFEPIEGFRPEVGTEYELLVDKIKLDNPPADASSIKYVLKSIVSEKSALKADALPKDCAGKKLVLKPELTKEEPGPKKILHILNLSLTYCDGSTSSHKVDQTPMAWVFPWWTKKDFDPEAKAAGVVLSARAKLPESQQATIRVVPQKGYLSIQRALQAWVAKPEGPEGVGPMNFIEFKRIAIPADAIVELQHK